ncbi:HTH-type transcriptional regulator KipR [Microbacterium lemovicicum]|uniref:HTH-type transcriptional regulator KipR n=1 Tax=Microbacterium lemovicicum TaxID=1072463 RepID=A0A3S9WE17_9MICO|nr:IclR family transcriptional regulator [Microbacterium lemovicicum]AZS38338.1 HTH-type transcriptional regulator KipR [Microbacterium lemovicicum]
MTDHGAKGGEASEDGARSLIDRAFAILGTFQGGRVRQSLSDISRRTDLPIATCHRIVGRLTEWGALERDAEGRYNIGLRLWEVASLAPRSVGLQRLARPHMQDLYETTGYASHLAIREGLELVSIDRFQSPRRQVRRPQIGVRYPMHATAIGLVLLANAPADVRAEVLAGELEAFTPRTYTDPAVLERVLDDIRRTGYAVSDRQVDKVHISVAAPVRASDDSVVAAVSLALTEKDVDGKNMIHLVRLTAASISRTLDAAGFGRVES